ncbi:E3 ubiquitin-protein ligase RSL1 [Typha latifolia]|uniref:E3 ubiquitin-protein ligase RSL1 n=1 Tax=Typha latifolia TaxID=4733 RepID=UPI003C2C4452
MDDDLDFVISDQHRELMAARAAESDLDLAFRLQMEEAMAASLSLLPSSSTTTATTETVEYVEKTDSSLLLDFQALELDRFLQEKRDAEQSQSELRRLADDLRIRYHDEQFAREIESMPEEDWEEFGDNFEQPIEEEELPFRLYFKGMLSSELVKGNWVQVAGIGVAVCDPQDNLVLKIQKPMSGAAGGREVVETKALIEGLNAVLSLGIKRVHVFFDYRILFNHVTGKWYVKQRKVANMIDQVLLLERKFEKCQMFLLPRCNVRFAFKLARDMIDSQIEKDADSNNNKDLKETCNICLELADSSEMFAVDDCLHRYCFSCMKQHVEVKLLHGMLPHCPHEGCNVKLNVESSRKFLTSKLLEIMVQRIKEESIPPAEKIYCPYPRCSALMSLNEAICPQQESSSQKSTFGTSRLRKCIKCDGSFCVKCKVPWHERMSCYDYKRLNPNRRPEDAKLQSLARQKLWRQCVKCNHMIELAEGCFHMTCRCGYEFCYTCGKKWKDKKATCSCPLWNEGFIWHDDSEDEDDFYDEEDDDDDESPFYQGFINFRRLH